MMECSEEGDPRRYQCPVSGCHKSFGKPSRLEIHIRSHTKQRPFKCTADGCDKTYARQQHLSRHIQTWHSSSIDQKPASKFKCHECSTEFATGYSLDKHLRTHEKEAAAIKKYKCPEPDCGEEFHKKSQLVTHRLTHEANLAIAARCHKCPYEGCGKSFVFPNKLKLHLKVHQGYKCDEDQCTEVLPTWSALRKHKAQQHSDFTCKECGAKMTTKQNFRQHLKVHQPTRQPVVCHEEGCGRSFLHLKNLRQHIRENHQGEKIWKGKKKISKLRPSKEEKSVKSRSAAACWLYVDDRGKTLKASRQAPAETVELLEQDTEMVDLAMTIPCENRETNLPGEDVGISNDLDPTSSPAATVKLPSSHQKLPTTQVPVQEEVSSDRLMEVSCLSPGSEVVKTKSSNSPLKTHVERLNRRKSENSYS